ncbi:Glutathione peroxidase [Trichinella pseudospiralis]|uniref:Glutathione peroxidase n=1 Tax=Trichinella pseudospiralis TaxID=6337 RepID=A0A0V1FU25_TRIPS|nr:Glutathione peroxidase [Trichinella pseudospiralis]
MASKSSDKSVYDFEAKDIDGNRKGIDHCQCRNNYKQLQQLYTKYESQGLRIAAFPCNQFGKQEPKSESEIKKFATERYGVTFDMYSKIDVNDANEHPLWHFLKSKLSGATGIPIKWNFAKFLIDQNGVPVRRYEPDDSPNSMEPDFVALLNKKDS